MSAGCDFAGPLLSISRRCPRSQLEIVSLPLRFRGDSLRLRSLNPLPALSSSNVVSLSIPGEDVLAVRCVDWVMVHDLVLCGVRSAGQVWSGS